MIDRLMIKPDSIMLKAINKSKDVILLMIDANHDQTMRLLVLMYPLFHKIRVLNKLFYTLECNFNNDINFTQL